MGAGPKGGGIMRGVKERDDFFLSRDNSSLSYFFTASSSSSMVFRSRPDSAQTRSSSASLTISSSLISSCNLAVIAAA